MKILAGQAQKVDPEDNNQDVTKDIGKIGEDVTIDMATSTDTGTESSKPSFLAPFYLLGRKVAEFFQQVMQEIKDAISKFLAFIYPEIFVTFLIFMVVMTGIFMACTNIKWAE